MASDDKPSTAASPDPTTAAGAGKAEEAATTATEKDVLLRLPDSQLHLVDRSRSHPLAAGDLSVVRVRSSCAGASLAAVVLLLPPEQWPPSSSTPPTTPSPQFIFSSFEWSGTSTFDERRAKKLTENTEAVANGILSGVVQFIGYFTGGVTNSKAAKKVFNLLPGEIALASLEGYGKICYAIEVAGKNVLSTSSTVTTELISYKYGGKAAAATNQGLGAAGHAARAVWAVFKIRQAWNPKSILKPRAIVKFTAKSMFNSSRAKSRL